MLNNEFFNWRNLLYRISSRFAKLCPTPEGKVSALIIDDTAIKKTGRRVENSSWFVDHCRKAYYMGYQTIMAVWHNGVVSIPLDLEQKNWKVKNQACQQKPLPKGDSHRTTPKNGKTEEDKDR